MPGSTDSHPDCHPDFEDFYLASRRRLVLEAYALTGDLGAARTSVRDAFVAAHRQWRRVARQADPEEWVRPRAWAIAQRRRAGHPWHREKGLSPEQATVLGALHHLSDRHRRSLLLAELAALDVTAIGRELGRTDDAVREDLAEASAAYCRDTGVAPEQVRTSLETLAPLADAAALPGIAFLERRAFQRRRLTAVLGTVALVLLTLAGGFLVVQDDQAAPAGASARPERIDPRVPREAPRGVSAEMLLDLAQVFTLAPDEPWTVTGTSDNTQGSGINSVCQSSRFADPQGRGTLVRTFRTVGRTHRSYVQTVEISRSPQEAAAAYDTTKGWFAGCSQARVQLLGSYSATGLADEAAIMRLRIPNKVRRTYGVGVARTGALTVSTVLETVDGQPLGIKGLTRGLVDAVRNVCMSQAAGQCPMFTRVAPVLPPLSGEAPGTLAVADLPVVGRINRPWVGTDPVPARPNVAATTCDRTDFRRAGARRPMTRTFLIPQARLPRRFGITETYGRFPKQRQAVALVRDVEATMAACEKKDLGAKVSGTVVARRGYRGSEYALWRLDSEIADKRTVGYWMGVARVGPYVAQVNFTAAGDADIDADTFEALVTRARDRLFELQRGAR